MTEVFFKVALVALFAISAHGATFGDLKVCDNLSEADNRNVALLCKIKNEMIAFLESENPDGDANAEVLNLIHSAKKLDHHKVSFLETLIKTLGGLAKAVDEIVKAKHHNSSRLKKGADDDLGAGHLSEADLVSVHQALGMNIGGGDAVDRFLESLGRVIGASESIFKLVRQNTKFAKLVEDAVSVLDHIVQDAKDSANQNQTSERSSTASNSDYTSTTPISDYSSAALTSDSTSTDSSSTIPSSDFSSTALTSDLTSTTPTPVSSSSSPTLVDGSGSSSASPAPTEESFSIKDSDEITYPVWSPECQKWINQTPDLIANSQFSSNFPPSAKRYIVKGTRPYGPYGSFYNFVALQSK